MKLLDTRMRAGSPGGDSCTRHCRRFGNARSATLHGVHGYEVPGTRTKWHVRLLLVLLLMHA